MKNLVVTAIVLTVAPLALAASAVASEPAFISSYGGKTVSLLRGALKLPVDGQVLLYSGDRVKAGKGSYVEVKYIVDGCSLRISDEQSIVISKSSPCMGAVDETEAGAAGQDIKIVPAAAGDVAARVTDKTGALSRANLGSGFIELKTGMELTVGSTVYAGSKSTVTVFFVKEKCSYTLGAEASLDITDVAPCVPSGGDSASAELTIPKTIDKHGLDGESSAGASSASTGMSAVGIALGAAAVVGGAALAVVAMSGEKQDSDVPATPQ
jgi:hypothetical protein